MDFDKRVKFNDITVRDAQQSLWATRMRNEDAVKIVRLNAKAGFNALEVWGGATFDVAVRYLGEDPWQNLRNIKAAVKKGAQEAGVKETPLMMLMRGQTAVGYKNYPDDVVRATVRKAAENGMNIFRIFDALNDTRNLETAIDEVRKCKDDGLPVEAQGTICYTTGNENPAAPKGASALQRQEVFNPGYYLKIARELKGLNVDSVCIKDMAGLMTPEVAAELIPAIKTETGLSVVLHMHAGMGLSDATLTQAVKSGVDIIDVGNAGLASGSGHSSAQMMLDMMKRSDDPELNGRRPDISREILKRVREKLLYMRPKYAAFETPYNPALQQKTYMAQIPGGMISNFESQIKGQIGGMNVEFDDVFKSVLDEVPKVRADLGWPPLVTPTSQIVGTQAVLNVLSELRGGQRYDMVSDETKALLLGKLGRTPVEPPAHMIAMAEEAAGQKRITHRPADDLEPALPKARELLKSEGLSDISEENAITVALWGQMGLDFIKNGHLPSHEEKPQLPYYMTAESAKQDVMGMGDINEAIGSHIIEALAQTAKEIGRIKNGFFKYLPEAELQYRKERYQNFINTKLEEMPAKLAECGLNPLQAAWILKTSPATTFDKVLHDRCVQLGVEAENIPQIHETKIS